MTTEQRLASCLQRIQTLDAKREELIDAKKAPTAHLLNRDTPTFVKMISAQFIAHADEELLKLYKEKEYLQMRAEMFQRAIDAFPGDELAPHEGPQCPAGKR